MPLNDPGAARPAVVAKCRPVAPAQRCAGNLPVLLLFHGGGFLLPSSASAMAAEVAKARSLDFEPRYVDYTDANPLQAWKDAKAAAGRAIRGGRDVYAYGFSAGGVLASLLAQKTRVQAAAAVAPPSNLTTWRRDDILWAFLGDPGPATKRFLSPVFHPTPHPIVVYHSRGDQVTPFEANRRWAHRDPRVRLVPTPGTHTTAERHFEIATRAIIRLRRIHLRQRVIGIGKAIGR